MHRQVIVLESKNALYPENCSDHDLTWDLNLNNEGIRGSLLTFKITDLRKSLIFIFRIN